MIFPSSCSMTLHVWCGDESFSLAPCMEEMVLEVFIYKS